MVSKNTAAVAASALLWTAAFSISGRSVDASRQQTTNDAIYSKAQADGAKAQFEKICAECHPFNEAGKKKPKDVPLGGETFFENWTGRSVGEIASTIALTMPNDGSATVSEEEARNLVAYILQQNGFAAGPKPLDKAAEAALIARPKK